MGQKKTIRKLLRAFNRSGEPDFSVSFPDPHPSAEPPMTVCVAALCDHGKAVVIAADRSVSSGSLGFCSNGPNRKIFTVTSNVAIAVAGSIREITSLRSSNRTICRRQRRKRL